MSPQQTVYIVGAGPGDPSLISARGLRHLKGADVVVHDHLVHPRLLRAARPDAELIDVGAAAPHPEEHDAICLLLAEKASLDQCERGRRPPARRRTVESRQHICRLRSSESIVSSSWLSLLSFRSFGL